MNRVTGALESDEASLAIADTGRIGFGVYARRPFEEGERVLVIEGVERVWRSVDDADALANPNWICIGEHRWIDPTGPARFLNHSCAPNIAFREPREFVAIRDIKPGEELTFDYSLTEDEPLWRMACRCGAHSCRGTVRAIQFLSEAVIERSRPFLTPHFRRARERRQGVPVPATDIIIP